MTAKRLRRILRSRWWVLAMASLLSVLAAVLVSQSRNDAIPEYEAIAVVTFNRLSGEVDDAGAQERLDAAEEIALTVNSADLPTGTDPLSPGVRAEVVARQTNLRLQFIGRGDSTDQASAVATTLLGRYLAAHQLDASDELTQRIADTAARLDAIVVSIVAATAPPNTGEIETSSRLRELQAEVDAFATLYGSLTAELLSPRNPPRSSATILADRDAASEGLRTAQDELLSLQFATGIMTVDNVDLAVLRAEEAQLRAALDTYIAQSIAEEPIGVVSPIEVGESGIPPTSLPIAIVVGLSVGLMIGVAGVVIADRIRQPLWEITELEPRYRLPEIVARPRTYGEQSVKPWYETAPHGQRKTGIQELRSHVEGWPAFGSGLVVGLGALAGSSPDVHELGADLAAALAYSGSWALLIDADYGNPSDLTEYRRHTLDLEDVVADPRQTVGEAAGRADGEKDFLGVSIRNRDADAADLLAQPAFATMLDATQELYDVVIVACPPTSSAGYHVLSQRLDAMILVAIAGDLAPVDVVNSLQTLGDRRSFPAGVVLMRPKVGPISLINRAAQESTPAPVRYRDAESEWHWSDNRGVGRKTATGAGTRQQHEEPAWDYREVMPPPEDAGVPSAELPREHSEIDPPTTGLEVAEPAMTTQRITRRALTKKSAQVPVAEKDVGRPRSPWSFPHRDG